MKQPVGTNGKKWFIQGLSLYTRYFPIKKGKNRLVRLMQTWNKSLGQLQVNTKLGMKIDLCFPEDEGWEVLYALGTYEHGTSILFQHILKPGDVVFDIGANIGWYSCLFATLCCPGGKVHAFEPVPWIYQKLNKNIAINHLENQVVANCNGVGNDNRTLEFYTFRGHPHGETSSVVRDGMQVNSTSTASTIILDEYIQKIGSPEIAAIKVDVEGMENLVLDGSQSILSGKKPPMWLFEINFETAAGQGYSPCDLLKRMKQYGYEFIRVKEAWGSAEKMRDETECGNGDNVLCYINAIHKERIQKARI